ncbi:alpha/beta hydrolase [Spirulina sp. CS-785/01]|uniref:alpha/beta hydrolase n=1 Tax=Spirulina sp. CS-785/01 TaxID=3021716 RepID=UPI00232F645B|nr:alpha/beta hydrolase [Spirulina sp. CS-785/01]MDB9315896.1 alpha/beta hydrolase [Spirulina sp. CS-785/01]
MQLLWLGLAVVIPLYGFICFALWKWQNRVVFLPTQETYSTPQAMGMPYEEVWLTLNDQEKLHAWWIPQTLGKGTVLFLHGNGLNMSASLNLVQAVVFYRLGLSVLMVDYRGYGKSQGKQFPTEQQVYMDAQRALEYLTQDRQISPQDILVYGHSLGGAIALHLATHNPDLAALLIQSSFTRMRDMADHDKIYKLFPIDWLLRYEFDSLSRVKTLNLPMFFIHGEADQRVPSYMSQQLYEAAITPIKDLYFVPGADHDHVPECGGETYIQRVKAFISHTSLGRLIVDS